MTDEQAAEFDRVAAWTAQTIEASGVTDAVPPACNGSGSPAALRWLAARLAIGPEERLLDTGAGLGGPAAWMARTTHARCFMAEPMLGAAKGARRLFGLPGVVAWSHQLPFPGAAFDAALAMAVLSTVEDKARYLEEVARVLAPAGRLGVLDYVRTDRLLPDPPANNAFQSGPELDSTLAGCGFEVTAAVMVSELPPAPSRWSEEADLIAERVSRVHRDDPAMRIAEEQEARFARLLDDRRLGVRLVHARRR